MKQIFILLLFLLLPASMLRAQDHWWPDVTFPNNTGMCDNAQPKLVLYDDFDGSKLNTDNNRNILQNTCILKTYFLY